MLLRAYRLACCFICTLASHSHSQTIALTYRYVSNPALPVEFIAYDFDTSSALRIAANGECSLISPTTGWMGGESGTDRLQRDADYTPLAALRLASLVMPQLLLSQAPGIADARQIDGYTNEFGGVTLSGEYPLGYRLFRTHDFPNPNDLPIHTVHFDLDMNGRLVRVHVPELDRETLFDLADGSSAALSYVKSFGDGQWQLEQVHIEPNGDLAIFDPENVIDRARDIAFAAAEAQRERSKKAASTKRGKSEIEKRVIESQNTGQPQSANFALIITGLIVIGVGSVAWWKNRS